MATLTYKLKTIDFLGRKVPVVLQNENGPCPLLAIANVLLLRNQIELPVNCPEVSQERLMSLVAGLLLDSNSEQRLDSQASEEYKANLRQHIADAIARLPKLTTGVDVNVQFHDIRGFEFTDEVAIFDLMDINLVHGWLADPQDTVVAEAIGRSSYNDLVSPVPAGLGTSLQAPIVQILPPTPQTSLASMHHPLPSGDLAAALGTSPRQTKPMHMSPLSSVPMTGTSPSPGELDASGMGMGSALSLASGSQQQALEEEDSQALQEALALSLQLSAQGGDAGITSAHELASADASTVRPAESAAPPHAPDQQADAPQLPLEAQVHSVGSAVAAHLTSQASADPPTVAGTSHVAPGSGGVPEASALPSSRAPTAQDQDRGGPAGAQLEAPLGTQQPSTGPASDPDRMRSPEPSTGSAAESDRGARKQEALLIQHFLESTSSQLTHYGLVRLHEGLKPRELAVFFRNNHFNTIFFHNDHIHILVTDQGYMFEKDVVWERLTAVNGDTEFVSSSFAPFASHASELQDQAATAAQLAQAAFAQVVPPRQPLGTAAGGSAAVDSDADFALALQLQQEEERREEDRRAAAQQAQRAEQQGQQAQQQGKAQPRGTLNTSLGVKMSGAGDRKEALNQVADQKFGKSFEELDGKARQSVGGTVGGQRTADGASDTVNPPAEGIKATGNDGASQKQNS
ncbi:hypothetical protein WJX72_004386 [[Myrmecia] bisecta]|uniref:MINDY deubiquitinase domain-containing protein n=1 Tax=[Myrmecia] bisecta TaxID=41462 RepID=A0AAW1Q001_9CHLO